MCRENIQLDSPVSSRATTSTKESGIRLRKARFLRAIPLLTLLAVALPMLPSTSTLTSTVLKPTTSTLAVNYRGPQGDHKGYLVVHVYQPKASYPVPTGVVKFYAKGPCGNTWVPCTEPFVEFASATLNSGTAQVPFVDGYPKNFVWFQAHYEGSKFYKSNLSVIAGVGPGF